MMSKAPQSTSPRISAKIPETTRITAKIQSNETTILILLFGPRAGQDIVSIPVSAASSNAVSDHRMIGHSYPGALISQQRLPPSGGARLNERRLSWRGFHPIDLRSAAVH